MKKISLIVFAALLLICASSCDGTTGQEATEVVESSAEVKASETSDSAEVSEKNENYTFRNTTWGMTKDEVKAQEENTLIDESEALLVYSGTVANLDAYVDYAFNDEQLLYAGYYIITESHTNDNLYIDDYEKLYDAITEKYGMPYEDKDVWSDDLYKDDPDKYGFAISLGDYKKYAKWETDDTNITVLIYGDNYDISLSMQYKSKEIAEPEEEDSGV